MKKSERRTENSKYSTRDYKDPKWLARLFHPDQSATGSRGYSGGVSSVFRIIQDIYTRYFLEK